MENDTDLFKLIYEHDLRIEQLSGDYDRTKENRRSSTLEEFMKPVQTYSKFYLTGTRLGPGLEARFGFNTLKRFESIFTLFREATGCAFFSDGSSVHPVTDFTPKLILDPEKTFILASDAALLTEDRLQQSRQIFSSALSVREKNGLMRPWLDDGCRVLFTERAHHGTDLHLFSRENIYEAFFERYQPLTGRPDFRFFSINGKRSKSERLFYFETWTLDRPPHGFEEVFPQTRLR